MNVEECGVKLTVGPPKTKTGGLSYTGRGFYNQKMGLGRDFVVLSAVTLHQCLSKVAFYNQTVRSYGSHSILCICFNYPILVNQECQVAAVTKGTII